MSNRLYVGNISWNTTEEGLKDWFGQCGEVTDVKIMIDRDSGRSRGFGFVTMASEDEAQKAMAELDGRTLDDRSLKVNEARERTDRDHRPGNQTYSEDSGMRRGGGRPDRPKRESRGGGSRRDNDRGRRGW